jgi:DNA-binding HxlR family transcriptional regulator
LDGAVRSYGQYCPVAKAAEIFGDRWTPLIVRELLAGIERFNDLERGLPGISRSVLAQRLQALERAGVIEPDVGPGGRAMRYRLTPAGCQLQEVIDVLGAWGARWAFREPEPDELDAGLLLWWMSRRVARERLPARRTVVRFDFASGRRREHLWLLLARAEVAVCRENPGFEEHLVVAADLADFYQVWLGRLPYPQAVRDGRVRLLGTPTLERAFPTWMEWSPMAEAVRASRAVGR